MEQRDPVTELVLSVVTAAAVVVTCFITTVITIVGATVLLVAFTPTSGVHGAGNWNLSTVIIIELPSLVAAQAVNVVVAQYVRRKLHTGWLFALFALPICFVASLGSAVALFVCSAVASWHPVLHLVTLLVGDIIAFTVAWLLSARLIG